MRVYNTSFSEEIWFQVNQDNKDLLDDFLLELRQRKLSSQTIYQYKADLRGFMCHVFRNLGNRSVLELTKKEYRGYSLKLIDDGKVSNARHNRVFSAIKSMLEYAENDDDLIYANNLARKVKCLPSEPIKDIVFLKDEVVLNVRDRLINDGELQKAALLMLAYDSAGRKGELAQVNKYSFLAFDRHNTNKVIGKGRKSFSLLYFLGTQYAVKDWLKFRGEDNIDSLWLVNDGNEKRPGTTYDIYGWFVDIREYLTVLEGKEIDFTPHSMRHSALTNYGDGSHYVCRQFGISGFPIEKLRLLAHHDSVDTTQHYLPDRSIDELENMFRIKIVG